MSLKFLANSVELILTLGHKLARKSSSAVAFGYENCSIRQALVKTHISKETDNSVRLAHYLLLKEWPAVRISNHFKMTDGVGKNLKKFSASVDQAAKFILDIAKIEARHCFTKVDKDFKVTVEFHSVKLVCSYKITVDFSHGFKTAKYNGVTFLPGVTTGYMVNSSTVDAITKSPASGWNYLKNLVEMFDQFKSEAEKML